MSRWKGLLIFLGALGCGEPTYTRVQAEVFNQSCLFSGCHVALSSQGGLSLEDPAYDRLVNVPAVTDPSKIRIVPGSAQDSFLYQKLTAAPPNEMPPGAPLEPE